MGVGFVSQFLRGEPVIICDFDAPQTSMVAVILGWDAKQGFWKARYLSPQRNLIYCWSDRPTRVADFGMTVEIDVANQEYRAVPDDGPRTATYEDGAPRRWQDYGLAIGAWHKARGPAFLLLQSWLAREIEKVTA